MSRTPTPAGAAKFHTRRLDARRASLEKTFAVGAMETAWKTYVRPGLRGQEILDLHDYNDFHWGRQQLFQNLYSDICAGRYAPLQSTPIRVEKKHGVTRTLVLPAPQDCVILQCIVESLLPNALKKQPSTNSFFSRSHGFSKPEFRFQKDYIWFRRWATFSKIRIEIISTHTHICTTDIANYFDNIDYAHLRNMIASIDGVDEVTLDVLFKVLDQISWRPDYLPPPGRSLPQVNFDAPRLLSHIYLYEVDEFLKTTTSNSFVRWVDDMTIAAVSLPAAKQILRDLDQIIMTRGLRLNSGKTQVLSANEARRYFYVSENEYLDLERSNIAKARKIPGQISLICRRLKVKFQSFCGKPRRGHWDKIIKRFVSIFGQLSDEAAVDFCIKNINDEPSLRETIFRYFTELGPNRQRCNALRGYIIGEHALDDSSLMQIARVLTEWKVVPDSQLHKDIRKIGIKLADHEYTSRSPFFLYASIWILAKYGLRKHVAQIVDANFELWKTSEFLSRQVAAIYPKFRGHPDGRRIRGLIATHRLASAISVFSSLDYMVAQAPAVGGDVLLYLLNGRNKGTYSIQRFLVCLHVLTCKEIDNAARIRHRSEALRYIVDPIYIKVLNSIRM